jgi:tRNA nucleotidyltransferase (CCA-adding enzyme)
MAPARLTRQLFDSQTPPQRLALERAIDQARRSRVDLYLVGGAVRDLLLGEGHVDLDLMLEGDAIAFADDVAAQLRAKVTRHPRFGTASLKGDGFHLDFAQARSETYERPGALPRVRPAALRDDLARRDFSVNAMALRLTGGRGDIVDPHGGRRDIAAKLVRVLHEGSFQDDATRILRALRYEGRLGFRLDEQTEAWLRRDLSYLATISGARVRRELERIALEPRAAEILARAESLGALGATHTALRFAPIAGAVESASQRAMPHRIEVVFAVLLAGATDRQRSDATGRLALTGAQEAAVRGLVALQATEVQLATDGLSPSEAVRLLEGRPVAAIEAFALLREGAAAGERARRYLDEWRRVRPRLDGHDLAALGVDPGPPVGALLRMLREARLDGRTRDRDDEERLVAQTLAKRGEPRAVAGARARG